MRTLEFRRWLKCEYLQRNGKPLADGTQVSRAANCSTVEQHEGNLDEHYDLDGLTGLLLKLAYTAEQSESGEQPRHKIPINGDAVNGSMTYRSAIQLYRKFCVSMFSVPQVLGTTQPEDDLLTEIIDDSLSKTEREALVKSRVGQGRFRNLVLELWDYRCAVTSSGILLTASHIKPWKTSSNLERLDGWNGIALSPTFDRAFDAGLLSFENDGSIRLSSRLPAQEAALLGIKTSLSVKGLHKSHYPYLSHHRDLVFLR